MEEKHIDLSGSQVAAILAAFEEHKKWKGMPAHLKVLPQYDITLKSDTKTVTVMFAPITLNGQVRIHVPFSGGYVVDKGTMKILKRFIVG